MTKKKIFKYPTGATIPEGAIYLNTVTQTKARDLASGSYNTNCWLVWHYFLVDVEEEATPPKPPVIPRGNEIKRIRIGSVEVNLNGRPFVIKVDTFSHEDSFGGYFNSNGEAIKHAGENGEEMLKVHAYDKDGNHIGDGGTF